MTCRSSAALHSNHDSSYVRFIDLLIAARKHAGCTQVELGGRLSRPQSYVSKVETRERRLDLVEFAEWCDALGADAQALLAALIADMKAPVQRRVRRQFNG